MSLALYSAVLLPFPSSPSSPPSFHTLPHCLSQYTSKRRISRRLNSSALCKYTFHSKGTKVTPKNEKCGYTIWLFCRSNIQFKNNFFTLVFHTTKRAQGNILEHESNNKRYKEDTGIKNSWGKRKFVASDVPWTYTTRRYQPRRLRYWHRTCFQVPAVSVEQRDMYSVITSSIFPAELS